MFAATTQNKEAHIDWDCVSNLGGGKCEGSVAFWLGAV